MTEDGAVEFVFRKVAEVIVDILSSDFESLAEGLAFGEFRECTSTGNGAGAAISFPFNVDDLIVFDLKEHFHLVAADRVTNDAFGVMRKVCLIAHEEVSRI